MANNMGLADTTTVVSFADSLETEPLETCSNKSRKISLKQYIASSNASSAFKCLPQMPMTAEPLETCSNKSPKVSLQQSRVVGGLVARVPSPSGEGKLARLVNDLEITEKEREELMYSKTFLKVQADIKARQKRQKLSAEREKKEKPKSKYTGIDQQFYVDKDKQCAQGAHCAQGMVKFVPTLLVLMWSIVLK